MASPRSSEKLKTLSELRAGTGEGVSPSPIPSLLKGIFGFLVIGGILFGLWLFLTYVPQFGKDYAGRDDTAAYPDSSPGLLPESPAMVDGVLPTPEPYPTPLPIPDTVVRPDRIEIPAIALDAPVKAVGYKVFDEGGQQFVQWGVPDEFAVGWASLTAGLGQPGNTVLDGHHNVYGEVFRHLVDIAIGDQITMHSGDKVFDFTVTEKWILPERDQPLEVRQKNAEYVLPTADVRLTIITCWPYASNTHRLIVVAKPAASSN